MDVIIKTSVETTIVLPNEEEEGWKKEIVGQEKDRRVEPRR